jgi:hypothetical protein
MKTIAILAAAASLLLTGCATTIRSDVTTFQQWPAAGLPDKSYVFEAPPASAQDTLELRTYQGMVSAELAKLGFTPATDSATAKLRVGVHFSTIDRPVRVLQATDPFLMGPSPYWGPRYYGRAFRRPYWGPYRWGGFGPYYDPFWYGPMEMQETIRHNYERQLRVSIATIEGQKLFDVTVQNTSRRQATPEVMPALVQSAFNGFPGENGKVKRVELQVE